MICAEQDFAKKMKANIICPMKSNISPKKTFAAPEQTKLRVGQYLSARFRPGCHFYCVQSSLFLPLYVKRVFCCHKGNYVWSSPNKKLSRFFARSKEKLFFSVLRFVALGQRGSQRSLSLLPSLSINEKGALTCKNRDETTFREEEEKM